MFKVNNKGTRVKSSGWKEEAKSENEKLRDSLPSEAIVHDSSTKMLFETYRKFTRKHVYQNHFFQKVLSHRTATLLKRFPGTAFSCEFCSVF